MASVFYLFNGVFLMNITLLKDDNSLILCAFQHAHMVLINFFRYFEASRGMAAVKKSLPILLSRERSEPKRTNRNASQ
ncbi:hypothetical protein CHI96_16265 [Proteus mirabilis]|nr:hypothetical protein CHI96_19050 [Proteus mirabilis]OZS65156.1 hypothetical protein CHI96_16265 [Proteus mirabilis]